jgi:hypothetical protein
MECGVKDLIHGTHCLTRFEGHSYDGNLHQIYSGRSEFEMLLTMRNYGKRRLILLNGEVNQKRVKKRHYLYCKVQVKGYFNIYIYIDLIYRGDEPYKQESPVQRNNIFRKHHFQPDALFYSYYTMLAIMCVNTMCE